MESAPWMAVKFSKLLDASLVYPTLNHSDSSSLGLLEPAGLGQVKPPPAFEFQLPVVGWRE